MVVGNVLIMLISLMSLVVILILVLIIGIGNMVMGIVVNDVLWFLVLVLLVMLLFFNLVMCLVNCNKEG